MCKIINTNKKIEDKIAAELANEPLLSGTKIEAAVSDNTVVLSGIVGQLRKKYLAGKIASRIAPSRMIEQHIEIILEKHRFDDWIFNEVSNRLQVNLGFSSDKIRIDVKDGYVELQGELPWSYQKELAFESISDLDGIREIHNNITVSPDSNEQLLKKQIHQILPMVTSNKIDIKLHGETLILIGVVSSEEEKNSIAKVISKIVGVKKIRNKLHVERK